jgi:hypothetical protein
MISEPGASNNIHLPEIDEDLGPIDTILEETSGTFAENRGQIENENILYYCNAGDHGIGFMRSGYLLTISGEDKQSQIISVAFDGSSDVVPEGIEPKEYVTSHFSGSDESRWATGVHEYEKIVYDDLYPGIDLVFSLTPDGPKYDWVIEPFADPTFIREGYSGIDSLSIDHDGWLIVKAGSGEIRQQPPLTYQYVDDGREIIPSHYLIDNDGAVTYDLGTYDRSHELVIDPLLGGTFLGTWSMESVHGVVTDSEDNIYLLGYTPSSTFPTTPGNYSQPAVGFDVFVTKFDPYLRTILYSVLIGGGRHDIPNAITIDEEGFVYVALHTASDDFPTTEGSYQEDLMGVVNPVIFKLSPGGSNLVFSTYLGGNSSVEYQTLILDKDRNIYLAGDNDDIVITKLSADGSEILTSTEFGGSQIDGVSDIATDEEGDVYITGYTGSPDFPTTPGCFQSIKGGLNQTNSHVNDAYLTKVSGNLTTIIYSTFLGGNVGDFSHSIVVDPSGCAIITGNTRSVDFPTTPGCLNSSHGGMSDMFVAKFNGNGSALLFSTYINSPDNEVDFGTDIAFDSKGNICILGGSQSHNFPITPGCFQPEFPGGGGHDFGSSVVVILDPEGSLIYATYASTGGEDYPVGIAVDSQDNIISAGWFSLAAEYLPTLPGCYDQQGYANDGFIIKFNTSANPNPIITMDPDQTYLDTQSIPLTGVVASDSTVLKYVWTVDDVVVWNGTEENYVLPPLPAGHHTVRYGALNRAGGWMETLDQDVIVHSRPIATILDSRPVAFRNTDQIELSGMGTDDGSIDWYSWRIGSTYFNGTESTLSHSPLPPGIYTTGFRVRDNFEVWSNETTMNITIVMKPKAVMIQFPEDVYASDEMIPFQCTSSDERRIDMVHWTSSVSGTLFLGDRSMTNLTGLSSGQHQIQVMIQDECGFWSDSSSGLLNVTNRPVTLIQSISPNPALSTDVIEFTGWAFDDGTVSNHLWKSSIDGILEDGPDATISISGLTPGSHLITYSAEDDTGFWSEPVTAELHITDRPTATIDSSSRDVLTSDDTLFLSGNGTDDGSITWYSWFSDLDGELYTTQEMIAPVTGLSVGTHTISLRTCDDLGFWSEPTSTTILVHQRPLAYISDISHSSALAETLITFVGSGADDGSITSYHWSSDKDGDLAQEAEFTMGSLSRGVHTISLRVQDDQGSWSLPVTETIVIMSRPIAVLTQISHSKALIGEEIFFSGYAIDDGPIMEVQWQSSIDGVFATERTTESSELSLGNHKIIFKARDMHGLWSEDAIGYVTIHSRPTAEIISVMKDSPALGEVHILKGTGTDDGKIVQYRWHSSLDGELFNGTLEEARISPLGTGIHLITFRVMDDQGVWSDDAVLEVEVQDVDQNENDDQTSFIFAAAFILIGLGGIFVLVLRMPDSKFRK